jgi:hypothetical protein
VLAGDDTDSAAHTRLLRRGSVASMLLALGRLAAAIQRIERAALGMDHHDAPSGGGAVELATAAPGAPALDVAVLSTDQLAGLQAVLELLDGQARSPELPLPPSGPRITGLDC